MLIGKSSYNTSLDTHMYEVEYPDWHKKLLAAIVIADNMFTQVDDEVNRNILF